MKNFKFPVALSKRIDEVNTLIEYAKEHKIHAIECESTWESIYVFDKIEVKNQFVKISYVEPCERNKQTKERFNVNDWGSLDELKYTLSWIKKCINKGVREDAKQLKLNNE